MTNVAYEIAVEMTAAAHKANNAIEGVCDYLEFLSLEPDKVQSNQDFILGTLSAIRSSGYYD